jgi:glycosidase
VPFIYFGEEIGQIGAKPDESIRNPMPWTGEANGGFTQAAKPGNGWRLRRATLPPKPATRLRSVSIAS